MKTTHFIIFIASVFLISCTQLSSTSTFTVETDSNIDNSDELLEIQNLVETINQPIHSINKGLKDNFSSELIETKKVLLKTEIEALFDPENKFCELPASVVKQLRKLKKNNKSWVPEYVSKFSRDLPDSAMSMQGTSISVLLHMIKIQSENGKNRDFILLGSPTFKNLVIEDYVLKEGFNSFFYTLDCSGYLNAAIQGSGAVPGSDIKASAKSALDKQRSLFIAGGVLVSPIAAAYYGNSLGVNLDTITRIKILEELSTIPDINNNDSIIVTASYQAIWMSNEGNTSFNGESDFTGKGGMGIGVASVSVNSESGVTLSKKSSYSFYKTYFTNKTVISALKPFTILDVKNKIETLR
jgi:hypothetical protein